MHVNLAMCYSRMVDYAMAGEEFQKAIELDSEHIDACLGLGNVHIRRGEMEEAIRVLERAVELDPSAEGLREKIDELRWRREP